MTDLLWQVAASPVKRRYVDGFVTGHSLLDLGAGRAFYGEEARARGLWAVALDLADSRPPGSRVPLVLGWATALPFRARAFDTVLAFDVLEHCDDDDDAMAEIARVTAQRLILSVPRPHPASLTPYNLTFKHYIDRSHRREYLEEGLVGLLERHGFSVRHLRPEGGVSPAVLAEFLPFPGLARRGLGLLYRLGALRNRDLYADLYAVADRLSP